MKTTTLMSATTIEIGNWAEDRAEEYLLAEGYEVLHRNWRSGRYELDIIARFGSTLHFVEVKCRKRGGLTTPQDAMTIGKQKALIKGATAYIEQYGVDLESQFDLISVEYDADGFSLEYTPYAILSHW